MTNILLAERELNLSCWGLPVRTQPVLFHLPCCSFLLTLRVSGSLWFIPGWSFDPLPFCLHACSYKLVGGVNLREAHLHVEDQLWRGVQCKERTAQVFCYSTRCKSLSPKHRAVLWAQGTSPKLYITFCHLMLSQFSYFQMEMLSVTAMFPGWSWGRCVCQHTCEAYCFLKAWCDHSVQIRPRLVAHFPTPRAGRWHCWPLEGAESEPGWTETASWSQFGSCVFTWRMVSTESSQSCMSKQQWWCCHQPCPSSEAACCSSKAGALTASVGILMPVLKPVHFSQITCMQMKRSLWSASECLLPPRRCLVMVRSDKFHLFYLDATQWEKQVWVLNTLEDRLESKGR